MTILSTTSANATTTKTTKVSKPKIDKKLAKVALNNLAQAKRALEGKAVSKKVQKREAVLAHREEDKSAALVLLATGATKKWSARFALVRAVTAMKLGASAEELQGCKALMTVVDWSALEQPVRDYAVAVKADADKISSILCGKPKVAPAPVAAPAPATTPVYGSVEQVKPSAPAKPAKPAMPAVKSIAAKAPAKPVSRVS